MWTRGAGQTAVARQGEMTAGALRQIDKDLSLGLGQGRLMR
jgi:hypothetical protein